MYNKWWKHPDKYKVFGVTIHEVEEAMGIRDNTPFDASEEKFAALEALLKVSLNVFEATSLVNHRYSNKGIVFNKFGTNGNVASLGAMFECVDNQVG